MEEEAKAVQEVAKTTGKAIDAAREAGGFIARFVAGPLVLSVTACLNSGRGAALASAGLFTASSLANGCSSFMPLSKRLRKHLIET